MTNKFFFFFTVYLPVFVHAQNKLSFDVGLGIGANQYPKTDLGVVGVQKIYWAENYELSTQLNYHLSPPKIKIPEMWVFSIGIKAQKTSIPFIVKGVPYFFDREGFPSIYVHSSVLDIYHQVSFKAFQSKKAAITPFFEMVFSFNDPFNFSKNQYQGQKEAIVSNPIFEKNMFYIIQNKTNQCGGKMGAGINMLFGTNRKTMFFLRAGYYLGVGIMQMYNLRTITVTQNSILISFYMSSYGSGIQFSMGIRHRLGGNKKTH